MKKFVALVLVVVALAAFAATASAGALGGEIVWNGVSTKKVK